MIMAMEPLKSQLEEKLRFQFDVESIDIPINGICEIRANQKRDWITICRFSSSENLRNILTMFEVNYELKIRNSRS
jgi:hypothetical protein